MIKNDEQFKQYFYLYLLEDLFEGEFDCFALESYLKNYLMLYGYNGIHDLLDLIQFYYDEGRI